LKIISRWGVGYDYIDVEAATRHNVLISMAFGGNHEAVADATLAMMGALGENIIRHHMQMLKTGWGGEAHPGLWRRTVGILGLGRIGKAVARRCRGFDMKILAYTRTPDPDYARENGITLVSLETLLKESDYVTLHVPYNPVTEKLINRERLALMKPNAYLINTSRGGLLDEEALYDALACKKIAGAALDNYRGKPPIVSPLLSLDNIVLSPHTSGNDLNAESQVGNLCTGAIEAFSEGKGPDKQYLLNPEVLHGVPAA
jgi:D-3-phosphoglycerate dehydrogenase